MENKKQFEAPVVEVKTFEVEDIVTTSVQTVGIDLPYHEWGNG